MAYNLDILEALYDDKAMDIEFLKDEIKHHSCEFFADLDAYRIFGEEETGVIEELESEHKVISRYIIDELSQRYFQMPIEMAIATKQQDVIKKLFFDAAYRMGCDEGLQAQINSDLDAIANKIDNRFTFDESALVHLIEASKASNIQLEEGIVRRSQRNKRQILKTDNDGKFYLAETTPDTNVHIYSDGYSIPTRSYVDRFGVEKVKTVASERVVLSAYPGYNNIGSEVSSEDALKEVMKNLFDNLELCVDTYKFYYTNNKDATLGVTTAVQNTAVLADDSTFDFFYKINSRNLPHLLGIQDGSILSSEAMNYFAEVGPRGTIVFPVNEHSSALDILKTLLKNRERIIADCGLVNTPNGVFQLMPWEKIILKTSSFMRGDFFKTCFCLVKLDRDKGIYSRHESFMTIASTKYGESMVNNSYDARTVLRDLIYTAKQKKDFIFRTFVEEYDMSEGMFVGIPASIGTGKAETIITKDGQRIKTLDRFRRILAANADDGSVVKSIENENMNRIFTPEEQALASIDLDGHLGIGASLSPEAHEFELQLREIIDAELEDDLRKIILPDTYTDEPEMPRRKK